jgi:hypothetical protein
MCRRSASLTLTQCIHGLFEVRRIPEGDGGITNILRFYYLEPKNILGTRCRASCQAGQNA